MAVEADGFRLQALEPLKQDKGNRTSKQLRMAVMAVVMTKPDGLKTETEAEKSTNNVRTRAPASTPARHWVPKRAPTIRGVSITRAPGGTISAREALVETVAKRKGHRLRPCSPPLHQWHCLHNSQC